MTTIVSIFTAYYVHLWSSFFPETPLSPPLPSFDGRAVQYPSMQNLRDYMSWRQVDCKLPVVTCKEFWLILRRSHQQSLQYDVLGTDPDWRTGCEEC